MNIVRIMKAVAFAAMALLALSCDNNDMSQPEEPQLEVNSNNISGKWQLVEWNESALDENTYVYLDIVRNDRTYTMYQNLDSFTDVPHVVTGSYYIDVDPEKGAVIRGNYDHDSGDWWIASDDETFIQKFSRIDTIPVAED